MRRLKDVRDKLSFNQENTAKYVGDKLKLIEKKNKALQKILEEYPLAEGKHECCDEKPNSSKTSKQEWRAKAAELHNKATRLREQSIAPQAELTRFEAEFNRIRIEAAIVRAQGAYSVAMTQETKALEPRVLVIRSASVEHNQKINPGTAAQAHKNENTESLRKKAAEEYVRVLKEAKYYGSNTRILELKESVKATNDWAKEARKYSVKAKAHNEILVSLEKDITKLRTKIDRLLLKASKLDAHAAYASVKAKPLNEATIIDRRAVNRLLETLKKGFKPAKNEVDTNLAAQLPASSKTEDDLIKKIEEQKEKIDVLELELGESKMKTNHENNRELTSQKLIFQRKLEEVETRAKEERTLASNQIADLKSELYDRKNSMADNESLADENANLQRALEELKSKGEEERNSAKKKIAALEEELSDLKKSMDKSEDLAKEKVNFQRKLEQMEYKAIEERKMVEMKIAALEEELDKADNLAEEKANFHRKLKEMESKANEERESAKKKIADLEEKLFDLQKSTENVEDLVTEKADLERKLEETESKAVEEKKSAEKKLEKQFKEFEEKLDIKEQLLNDNDLCVVELEEKNDVLNETVKNLKYKESELMDRIRSLTAELGQARKTHRKTMEKAQSGQRDRDKENEAYEDNSDFSSGYSV